MDVYWEVLATYPTNTGIKIKFYWWNKNGHYRIFTKPSTVKLSLTKWHEFIPYDWKKDYNENN